MNSQLQIQQNPAIAESLVTQVFSAIAGFPLSCRLPFPPKKSYCKNMLGYLYFSLIFNIKDQDTYYPKKPLIIDLTKNFQLCLANLFSLIHAESIINTVYLAFSLPDSLNFFLPRFFQSVFSLEIKPISVTMNVVGLQTGSAGHACWPRQQLTWPAEVICKLTSLS